MKEIEVVDPELPATLHDDDNEQRRIYGGSTVKLRRWAYTIFFYRF